MMTYNVHITPHGIKDLGWLKAPGDIAAHYWQSGEKTTLALSHCEEIETASKLVNPVGVMVCKYCLMIESLRDALDAY